MSRHYAHVPQAPLIEAINELPTIQEWLDQDWMKSPVALPPTSEDPKEGRTRSWRGCI
jgi:hypothetical protein